MQKFSSRLKKAVNSAVETIAPRQSREDIFFKHVQRLESIHHNGELEEIDGGEEELAVAFNHSLDVITKLLMQEHAEERDESVDQNSEHSTPADNSLTPPQGPADQFNGPCLDLLVSRDVIPVLTAVAQSDYPKGVAVHTVKVLTNFIEIFGDMLIPQQTIHRHLNNLVKALSRKLWSSSNSTEADHTSQLRRVLVSYLATVIRKITKFHELGSFFFFDDGHGAEFCVFTALTQFYFVGTAGERDIAKGALIDCLHLPSTDLASWVCHKTDFPTSLVAQLCIAFKQSSHAQPEANDNPSLENCLSFYDECCSAGHDQVGNTLADLFGTDLLAKVAASSLRSVNEAVALHSMRALREMLYVSDPALQDRVVRFVLEGDNVLSLLVSRVLHPNPNVAIAALSLFEVLLALNRSDVMTVLVSKHLAHGVFHSDVTEESLLEIADVTSSGLLGYLTNTSPTLSKRGSSRRWSVGSLNSDGGGGGDDEDNPKSAFKAYLVDAESAVSAMVDCYDDTQLRSSTVVSPIADQVIAQAVLDHANLPMPDDAGDNNADDPRGAFLAAVFERLSLVLDQPYGLNVAVTGVVSRLASQIDPVLHTFFLNYKAPLREKIESAPAILRQVLVDAKEEGLELEDFDERKEQAQKQLEEGTVVMGSPELELERVVFAIVVAEELSKELCAIAAAKNVMKDLYKNLDNLYGETDVI